MLALDHPWIDARHAPIYVMRFAPNPTDEELESFCAARERWARAASYPVAWVVDLRFLTQASARQRRLFSEHLGRFEAHDLAHNRGSALVVPNALVRGLVTAVFWLREPKFPHRAFPTYDDAFAWARAQLA